MQISYWPLLASVAPVFLIILTGFISRRVGWLTREADHSLLKVCVNGLMPCLILDSILGNPALTQIENVTIPPFIGFFTFLIGYVIALYSGRLLRLTENQARTFSFTVGTYNYAYIPIPLVLAFCPKETTGVLFTHNLGAEIAFWTLGIGVLTGASLKSGWKKIFNPPVFAILGSLLLNAFHGANWLPAFIVKSAHMAGQSAVPLSLILTGATLADLVYHSWPRLTGVTPTGSIFLRIALLPVLSLLLAKYLPFSIELKRVIVIQAAMPAGMLPIVISKHFGGDAATALQVVIATSLIGLLTIPFWIQFGVYFTGITMGGH